MKIKTKVSGFRWDDNTVHVVVTLPDGTLTTANFTLAPWHAQKMKKDIFVGAELEIDDPFYSATAEHIQVKGKLLSAERDPASGEWRVAIESGGTTRHLTGEFYGLDDVAAKVGKHVVLDLRRAPNKG